MSTDMRSFVAALPKVELHVHLVGSASVDTVLELARRHPERGVPTELDALRRFYQFTDFAHFIDVYIKVNSLVTSGADVVTLLIGLAGDLAANRVRYAEVTVTPYNQIAVGIEPDELAQALETGRDLALARHGVRLAWIFDAPGEHGLLGAHETLIWALKYRPAGTVGYGLAGPELGVGRAQFAPMFTQAREAGLHSVPHAGETTGPATVWAAVHELGAERIGHGIQAVTDPRLLDYLREHRIPLEVCPSSNVCTQAVPSLAVHPLARLIQAGVPVTLATDDPGMFETDLNREYLLCHTEFGLTPAELVLLARTGIEAAFCEPDVRTELFTELDAVVLPHA